MVGIEARAVGPQDEQRTKTTRCLSIDGVCQDGQDEAEAVVARWNFQDSKARKKRKEYKLGENGGVWKVRKDEDGTTKEGLEEARHREAEQPT